MIDYPTSLQPQNERYLMQLLDYPASTVGGGDLGVVIAALLKVDADGNESVKFLFQKSSDGTMSEEPIENIRFTPAIA